MQGLRGESRLVVTRMVSIAGIALGSRSTLSLLGNHMKVVASTEFSTGSATATSKV